MRSNTKSTANKVFSLAEISIEEDLYNADLQLLDKYQAFSTELLRLSLLGIGVCGFLLKEVVFKFPDSSAFLTTLKGARITFGSGIALLAGSAAFALGHRYFSADSMAYQLAYLRYKTVRDKSTEEDDRFAKSNAHMLREKEGMHKRLRASWWCLLISTILLAIGIIAIAITFASTMFI